MKDCLNGIDSIILAGGLGTRLRQVIPDSPKVLALVAGRPILDLIVDWLSGFGIRRIILSLGYKADAVIEHITNMPQGKTEFIPVVESKPLGTGGALREAFDCCHSDPILAVNGDTLVTADLCTFLDFHCLGDTEMSLLYAKVDDGNRYGQLTLSEGRIQGFQEKNKNNTGNAVVSAGVYLFKTDFLSKIPKNQILSLEKDIIARSAPGSIAAWGEDVDFVDVGTPESFFEANRKFYDR